MHSAVGGATKELMERQIRWRKLVKKKNKQTERRGDLAVRRSNGKSHNLPSMAERQKLKSKK